MVFMAMGQNNGFDFFFVFPEVAEIGDNQVHAGHVIIREH